MGYLMLILIIAIIMIMIIENSNNANKSYNTHNANDDNPVNEIIIKIMETINEGGSIDNGNITVDYILVLPLK